MNSPVRNKLLTLRDILPSTVSPMAVEQRFSHGRKNPRRSLELLRVGSGRASATFRERQEEAIRYIVEGRGRLLIVQKTGWGKSFVYFIATKLQHEAAKVRRY